MRYLLPFLLATASALHFIAVAETNSPTRLAFEGRVVDAAGGPIAGAVVEFFQSDSGMPPVGEMLKPGQSMTTGADGKFAFRGNVSTTILFTRKPGFGPAWNTLWNVQQDRREEQLVLSLPAAIAGTVVDGSEKPVPGAAVWITTAYSEYQTEDGRMAASYLNAMPHRELFTAQTDIDGRFRIEGCPTNATLDLAVGKPGKVLRPVPREYTGPDTMRCRVGQQDIKLILDEAGTLEGRLRSQESGQPIAGASIFLEAQRPGFVDASRPGPMWTGVDGRFALTSVAPGNYSVRAAAGTNQVPDWVAEFVSVNIEAGRTTRNIEISAMRGGFIELSVVNKEGRKPVSGARAIAYRAGFQTTAISSSNGLALMRLPSGDYQVSANLGESRTEGTRATVEEGQTNRVEMELSSPPRIIGIVTDPDGKPVPNLKLVVFPPWRANVGSLQTDAKGGFELPWSPQHYSGMDNNLCLIARDRERKLAAAQDLEEGTTNLDLRLEAGLVLVGRVEDVAGKPLTNAAIQVNLWSGNMGSQLDDQPAKTDREGRFEVNSLPHNRRYTVHAGARGYGSGDQSVGQDTETNRVELEPFVLRVADRKIAGQVVDGDDKPVAKAGVSIYGQGQPNLSTRTDELGRFHFDQVCEGPVQLSANAQRSYGNVRADAGDTNVILRLGANESSSVRAVPTRASLQGKPLPDLAGFGLGAEVAPADRSVLLCLFDVEQRPSRRLVRMLAEQQEDLRQKGLVVIGVQATTMTPDAFKEWKDSATPPFPVGSVSSKDDKSAWASQVGSLPWLILTDPNHLVIVEGFPFDELEAKLKASQ